MIEKINNRTIDGKEVRVLRQGLRSRLATKARIIKFAGPAIFEGVLPLFQSLKTMKKEDLKDLKDEVDANPEELLNKVNIGDMDIQGLLRPAVISICQTLEADEFLKLIDMLMVGVTVNAVDVADPDKFDVVFDECMGTMYKVIFYVLEVNFKDLFKDLSILNILQKKTVEAPEQSTSGAN